MIKPISENEFYALDISKRVELLVSRDFVFLVNRRVPWAVKIFKSAQFNQDSTMQRMAATVCPLYILEDDGIHGFDQLTLRTKGVFVTRSLFIKGLNHGHKFIADCVIRCFTDESTTLAAHVANMLSIDDLAKAYAQRAGYMSDIILKTVLSRNDIFKADDAFRESLVNDAMRSTSDEIQLLAMAIIPESLLNLEQTTNYFDPPSPGSL